jgi:hypothetical protein
MGEDRLTKEAIDRLQELGLPLYLLETEIFRDGFLLHSWLLLVRDRGNVTEVDLFHPEQVKALTAKSRSREENF